MAHLIEKEPVVGDEGSFEEETSSKPRKAKSNLRKRSGAVVFSATVFAFALVVAGLGFYQLAGWLGLIPAFLLALLVASSIHIAFAWERIVILRFGSFSRIVNPGLYFTIPVIEQIALHVDQRINVTPFLNERALTSDLAPVDVDAVVFWMVWDAKQAYTQVVDYPSAVSWSAQTALRDAIGQISLTDVPVKRLQIDHEVQERLDRKLADWGISVISVEIRDIVMPDDLQSAMSKAAQAEREKDARIILAEAEKETSFMFVEAAKAYGEPEAALKLRIANLLYEGVKDNGGLVIVPSSFSDSLSAVEKLVDFKN